MCTTWFMFMCVHWGRKWGTDRGGVIMSYMASLWRLMSPKGCSSQSGAQIIQWYLYPKTRDCSLTLEGLIYQFRGKTNLCSAQGKKSGRIPFCSERLTLFLLSISSDEVLSHQEKQSALLWSRKPKRWSLVVTGVISLLFIHWFCC